MDNNQVYDSSSSTPQARLPPPPAPRTLEHIAAPESVTAPASIPALPVPVEAAIPDPAPAPVVPSAAPPPGPTARATGFDGWSQSPIIIGAVIGTAVLIALALLGCFAIYRRRQWKKLNRGVPSMSETETLISKRSMDSNVAPKYNKRFDIENPPPVYLAKSQGRPGLSHLKTLHLLSRSSSIASTSTSNSTLVNGSRKGGRIYSTQPAIPTVSITHDTMTGATHEPYRSSLPDGFESFIYSLRSPQLIEGDIAKRLSLVSTISAIRFARDSNGWALRRASDISLDRATVFDGDQSKEASPPLPVAISSPPNPHRISQKPRKKSRPSLQVNIPEVPSRYKDVVEEIEYQPTPLAPPPAQIRARSVTPTNFVVRRTASIESADTILGPTTDKASTSRTAPKEAGKDTPIVRPSGILHSAVSKGKVSREEAEWALGMRLVLTP